MFALFGRISPAQAKVVLSSRDKEKNKSIKVTRVLPDPNISPLGHTILALLFYGFFIAYIVFAINEYIDQPPTTTVTMVDSNDYSVVPAFNVRIGVECKTATGATGTCGEMLLSANYTNFPLSPCYQSGSVTVTKDGNSQMQNIAFSGGSVFNIRMIPHNSSANRLFYNVPLCFTTQEPLLLASIFGSGNLPISMIQVGFLELNNSGVLGAEMSIEVSGSSSSSNSNQQFVSRTINVNSDHSVRVLPIFGVVERGVDNEVISFEPSAQVIEFEGFRQQPSSSTLHRSDVVIVMQSKTVLRKREQVKSLWDLVSNIGSAFETLMGFMPLLLPIWGMVFVAQSKWLSPFVVGGGGLPSSTKESFSNKDKYAPANAAEHEGSRTASSESFKEAVAMQHSVEGITPVSKCVVVEEN